MRVGKRPAVQNETRYRSRRDLLHAGACTGVVLALGSGGLSCCLRRSQEERASASMAAERVPSDWTMIAYCCLECDKCDIYVATQKNDDALRAEATTERKRDAEKPRCYGCKSGNALYNCEAKKCAMVKGLPTCAHCGDFPTCDKEVWRKWPQLKEKVESMRARLRLS